MTANVPVICKTPGCKKRLADHLDGVAIFTCPRCKQTHTYDTTKGS